MAKQTSVEPPAQQAGRTGPDLRAEAQPGRGRETVKDERTVGGNRKRGVRRDRKRG